jgi:hypothetical protein
MRKLQKKEKESNQISSQLNPTEQAVGVLESGGAGVSFTATPDEGIFFKVLESYIHK